MEVVIPVSSPDFNFESACSSPYIPSTPKRFGEHHHYFSAPSSPTHAAAFYREYNSFSSNSSVIPYDWEEIPGTPKSQNPQTEEDEEVKEEKIDFAFDFGGGQSSLPADELFDDGKIKPLKPPPRLEVNNEFGFRRSPVSSPKSPIAMIRKALSPKGAKEPNPNPFIEESRRGRERVAVYSSSNASRKGSRSLSPYRSSGYQQEQSRDSTTNKPMYSKPSSSSSSKKWSFRDLLLFRSASEGRASERDPLRKFSLHSKKNDDSKNCSFRSTDSSGSMRRNRISAHELHYKSNRAVAEEMKRKTVLPYKQGLFAWFKI